MKNNRFICRLPIVLVILMYSLLVNKVNAQGPNAPEAASFEPVDATDMVNLMTGDLSYVLPLLNVPSSEGGYPIALSYRAGIALDQEASWTGLGWNLNPGAINRLVNGNADDWNRAIIKEFAYDEGGSESSTTISIGYGVPGKWSAGVGVSWGSNRSLGGSVNASFSGLYGSVGTDGITAGVGFSDHFGVNASVGFNGSVGVGINAGLATNPLLVSLGVGYGPNGFRGSGSISQGVNSLGIDLSSSGLSVTMKSLGIGTSMSNNFNRSISQNDYNVNRSSFGFSITSPWGYFSFGKNKIDWELRKITTNQVEGSMHLRPVNSIYVGEDTNELNYYDEDYNRIKDVYSLSIEKIFEQSSEDSYIDNNNGILANHDLYDVNAQGLGGTISPSILNNLRLFPFSNQYIHKKNKFIVHTELNDNLTANNLHYRGNLNFNPGSNSFLNVLPYEMTYSQGEVSYNTLVPSSSLPNDFSYNQDQTLIYHNTSYNPNPGKKKVRNGRHVEYFTVSDINIGTSASSGFLEAYQENHSFRDLASCGYGFYHRYPVYKYTLDESIGAIKVTSVDGTTYHYSLPVYQAEKVRRLYGIVENKTENQAHMDRMDMNPYATHWLLTAITGPDYVKTDINRNYPDEGDYGYWVRFDYGLWSGGYIWKTPNDEYSKNVDVFGKVKEYTWGRKQIYYLDKIKTNTHTALFVKRIREDNKSEDMSYKNMTHIADPNASYMSVQSHPLLGLDKIILLKNEDAQNISKDSGIPLIASKNYNYYTEATKTRDNAQSPWIYNDAYLKQYSVNNSDKILDINDLDGLNIEEKAIKIIKFDYDYSLANGAPNSNSGRLTLKGVNFLGKKGVSILPPTKFEYASAYNLYNSDKKNDFGYYKNSPQTWSLNKIKMPTGGNIDIEYESDEYSKVAIKNGRVFTSKLKFTFVTEPPRGYGDDLNSMKNAPKGITRIKIELDSSDPDSQGILFSDHFDSSEPFFIDMWYSAVYNHSGAGYDRSAVNIDAESATIVELNSSQNYMIIDVLASSPSFRDVFQHSAEPVSVLNASGDYLGIENQNKPRFELAWDPDQGHRKYSMRHTIIGNKIDQDSNSGIRVKKITVNDNAGKNYITNYSYQNPVTGQSSGIIPYYPEPNYAINQQAPYISLLPGPVVTYEYVTESNSLGKKEYRFKTLEEVTESNNLISFGDALKIQCSEENPTNDINLNYVTIQNNLKSLGRIEHIKEFNAQNQLISKRVNNYSSMDDDYSLGQSRQSFYAAKTVEDYIENTSKVYYNVTSKLNITNQLESTIVTQAGFSSTTYFNKHDFLTDQVLETTTTSSRGDEFKTEIIPAYTIAEYNPYGGSGMGTKADNINNKNMLTQEVMSKAYIKIGNDWEETGVGITTWNNNWTYINEDGTTNLPSNFSEKIWRKHKNFIWDGDIKADGTYKDFIGDDDNFNWTVGQNIVQTNPKWKNVTTATKYDHYSTPLEIKDINDNYAATKMCDDNSKVLAVSNAAYTEMYFSSAEYISSDPAYFDGQVKSAGQNNTQAHTGNYSVHIQSGGHKAFEVLLPSNSKRNNTKFKISVWVRNNVHEAMISINGTNHFFNGEEVAAGDWVQKNHYVTLDSNAQTIYITSLGLPIYVDDFRLHPVASAMTGYVYNEWGELWYIIGNNGLASRFEYDDAGRLITTYTEVVDFNGLGSGGFKKVSENDYNFKIQQ